MTQQQLIDNFCIESPNFVIHESRFYDFSEACVSVLKRQQRHPNDDLGAFMFSYEQFIEFADEVRRIHNSSTGTEVGGIRLWKGFNDINGNCSETLLMMPVHKTTETDLFRIDNTRPTAPNIPDKLLILGDARPCPNMCGSADTQFFYKHPAAPTNTNTLNCT